MCECIDKRFPPALVYRTERRSVSKMNLHVPDIRSENEMDENRLHLIQFKAGEIVWAAITGQRFWPAIIIQHSFDKCLING